MISEIRIKNCLSFMEKTVFSLEADKRIRKFAFNYFEGSFNILKTAGIFGQNNAGKTNLIKCISAIQRILVNRKPEVRPNFFSENPVIELGISFIYNNKKYSCDFKYDVAKSEYVYERFCEIIKDGFNNEKEDVWLLRDYRSGRFETTDDNLKEMIGSVAKNAILIYLVDTSKFAFMSRMKNIMENLAAGIDIIDSNNIPINKTLKLLKNKSVTMGKVVSFIKKADVYMEDIYYSDDKKIKVLSDKGEELPQEKALNIPEQLLDLMHLVSVYKGRQVSSLFVDSTGTKKLEALASYVIDALENGRILIIDELDSSLHFRITRAIISMFNNILNTNAQLIFTAHDTNLMDCRKLLRKDQIWFTHKDNSGVYLYPLSRFTAKKTGIRNNTDIAARYKKGVLGALPEPDLIDILLEINKSRNKKDATSS